MIRSLALLLLIGLTASLAAEGVLRDPVVVGQMPWSDRAGYTPVVVEITSLRPRAIVLEAVVGQSTARLETAVPVGSSRHTLLLPPQGERQVYWGELHWRSDDERDGTEAITGRLGDEDVLVLVDPRRGIDELEVETAIKSWDTRYGYHSSAYERLDVELLPDRWQGYPQDLVLLLHASALDGLGEAQRQALDAWARSGGLLVLAGGDPQRLGLPSARRFNGDWASWATAMQREREQRRDYHPLRVPVPGTEEVPAGAFAWMAVLFALVAGPLNLWWALRRRQRWLLLVTTPLISALTCVVLVAVNLMSEGVTTRRVVEQLLWLDGSSHQAVAWTGVTAFAPFAGGNVEVSPLIEISPLEQEESGYRRHRSPQHWGELALDWTTGQRLGGSWLPPRVNRRLLYTEPRPLRQRLLLRAEGEGLVLVNGLEQGIELIHYIDAHGRQWQGEAIAPGSEVALSPELDHSLEYRLQPTELGPIAKARMATVQEPGYFRARLQAPLLPIPGFEGSDSEPPVGLVCGPLQVEGRP